MQIILLTQAHPLKTFQFHVYVTFIFAVYVTAEIQIRRDVDQL